MKRHATAQPSVPDPGSWIPGQGLAAALWMAFCFLGCSPPPPESPPLPKGVSLVEPEAPVGEDPSPLPYLQAGNPNRPLVLLLHGSEQDPAVWLPLLSATSLWACSELKAPQMLHNQRSGQATVLRPGETLFHETLHLLEANPYRPLYIIAEGRAAAVAVRMIRMFPEMIRGLILCDPILAPIGPDLSSTSQDLRDEAGFTAAFWQDVQCPVTIIMGQKGKDPSPDLDFAVNNMRRAVLKITQVTGLRGPVSRDRSDLVKEALLDQLLRPNFFDK